MPLLTEILWILFIIAAFGGLWYLLRDQDWLPEGELYTALTAGFIGSIFFALISPVIVPMGHHALAMYVVDSPEPTFTASHSDEPPPFVAVNDSNDTDYYAVTIINQADRPISSLSLSIDFAGCIDQKGTRSYSGIEPSNYEAAWAPGSIVHFSKPFEQSGELTQCDGGVYIETLPAHSMVTTYFVVDHDPEENVQMDFTDANIESGQVYLRYSYSWDYRSIKRFPSPSPQIVNATQS
ncbi:hypothetical protein [Halolamina sp. C58]|uniref:hypothetical protein n=1 Tax=Halolamina sp. C58 TaxID=3421640 RepID=UPI003EB8E3B3